MPEEIYPMEQDWDYLLVLDACRYDYFEKVYDDYFEGDLRRVRSPGSETSEWCRNVFTEKYDDVVYVSGNPRINSKVEVRGFDASEHFHEVVDVWDWGWDHELGTVRPEVINEAVLDARGEYPDKRIIVQYMQPHAPYLGLDPLEYTADRDPEDHKLGSKDKGLRNFFGPKFREIFGPNFTRKVRDFFNLSPLGPLEAALREVGVERLKELYSENVRAGLKHSAILYEELSGKVVLTADHGELLCERGYFAHPRGKNIPELREVPWFEVKRVKFDGVNDSKRDSIARKVNSLKKDDKI